MAVNLQRFDGWYETPRLGDTDMFTPASPVDQEILERARVGHVGGRAHAGAQVQGRAEPDRELVGDLEAGPESEREGRHPIAVELRVQAVREVLLALVGVERVEVGEVAVGQDAVEAEGQPVVEELRDEADGLVDDRLVSGAGALPRVGGEGRVEHRGGAPVLEDARGNGHVPERRPAGVGRVRDAVGNRELRAGSAVERDPYLFAHRQDADREPEGQVDQERRVEVRGRSAAHHRCACLEALPVPSIAPRQGRRAETPPLFPPRRGRRPRTGMRARSTRRPVRDPQFAALEVMLGASDRIAAQMVASSPVAWVGPRRAKTTKCSDASLSRVPDAVCVRSEEPL